MILTGKKKVTLTSEVCAQNLSSQLLIARKKTKRKTKKKEAELLPLFYFDKKLGS